jgi:hypothetical protein
VDTVQNVRQSFCVVDEVAVASIFQRLAMEVEVAVVEVFRELPLKTKTRLRIDGTSFIRYYWWRCFRWWWSLSNLNVSKRGI